MPTFIIVGYRAIIYERQNDFNCFYCKPMTVRSLYTEVVEYGVCLKVYYSTTCTCMCMHVCVCVRVCLFQPHPILFLDQNPLSTPVISLNH